MAKVKRTRKKAKEFYLMSYKGNARFGDRRVDFIGPFKSRESAAAFREKCISTAPDVSWYGVKQEMQSSEIVSPTVWTLEKYFKTSLSPRQTLNKNATYVFYEDYDASSRANTYNFIGPISGISGGSLARAMAREISDKGPWIFTKGWRTSMAQQLAMIKSEKDGQEKERKRLRHNWECSVFGQLRRSWPSDRLGILKDVVGSQWEKKIETPWIRREIRKLLREKKP